jgi:hypothetical protein
LFQHLGLKKKRKDNSETWFSHLTSSPRLSSLQAFYELETISPQSKPPIKARKTFFETPPFKPKSLNLCVDDDDITLSLLLVFHFAKSADFTLEYEGVQCLL